MKTLGIVAMAAIVVALTQPVASAGTDKATSMPLVYNGSRGGGAFGPAVAVDTSFDYYERRPMRAVARAMSAEGITCAFLTDTGAEGMPPSKLAACAAGLRAGGIEPVLRLFPTTDFDLYERHPEWRQRTVAGIDGRYDWRVYLCPNHPAYVAAQCARLQYVMRMGQFRAIQLAEPWLEQWGGPDDNGRPREGYSCVCETCRARFREIGGTDPVEMLTSQTSPLYFRKAENAAMYAKWVDFRVDTVTSFTRTLCEAARQTSSAVAINIMYLSDARVEPGKVREYQGVDLERLVAEIRPDILTIQDAWQDWQRPDLRPDFVADYARLYAGRVRMLKPDIFIMSHADIGSMASSSRSRDWIRQFAAATQACGLDAPSFYEWSISCMAGAVPEQ